MGAEIQKHHYDLGYVVAQMDEGHDHTDWGLVDQKERKLIRSLPDAAIYPTIVRAFEAFERVRGFKLTSTKALSIAYHQDDLKMYPLSASVYTREVSLELLEAFEEYRLLQSELFAKVNPSEREKVLTSLNVDFNLEAGLNPETNIPDDKASFMAAVTDKGQLSFIGYDKKLMSSSAIFLARHYEDTSSAMGLLQEQVKNNVQPLFLAAVAYNLGPVINAEDIEARIVPDALSRLSDTGRAAYEKLKNSRWTRQQPN